MTSPHMTEDELQAVVEGTVAPDRLVAIDGHLRECVTCTHRFDEIRRLESAIRSLPLEHTRAGFTASVMRRAGLAPVARAGWVLLDNIPYLFALLVVVGVLLIVYLWTGTLGSAQVASGESILGELLGKGRDYLTEANQSLKGWITLVLIPFRGGLGMGISAVALLVLLCLALIDRAWAPRLRHRAR